MPDGGVYDDGGSIPLEVEPSVPVDSLPVDDEAIVALGSSAACGAVGPDSVAAVAGASGVGDEGVRPAGIV